MSKSKKLKGSKLPTLQELGQKTGLQIKRALRVDAEHLHSTNQTRTIHSQVCGSTDRVRVGFEMTASRGLVQLEQLQPLVRSPSQLHLRRSAKKPLC
jgi:hypothetical protein